jgi:hypothetical protein
LKDGSQLEKGKAADIDDFRLPGVLDYRTLVLRRSPVTGRPPSPYRLVERGRYYETWQRPPVAVNTVKEHLSLGGTLEPAGVPSCDEVQRLAEVAGPEGTLIAAPPARPLVLDLNRSQHTSSWVRLPDRPGSLKAAGSGNATGSGSPSGSGSAEVGADLRAPGRYRFWLGGSFGGRATLRIDGKRVGSARNRVNNAGQYEEMGTRFASAGDHTVTVDYSEGGLRPGTRARPAVIGPIVIEPTASDRALRRIAPANATSLCGKRWDWIEAVR